MQARLSSQHAKEMARLCLEHWHEYNMRPIEEMGELVLGLKSGDLVFTFAPTHHSGCWTAINR